MMNMKSNRQEILLFAVVILTLLSTLAYALQWPIPESDSTPDQISSCEDGDGF